MSMELNPFTRGSGARPPVLAGREEFLDHVMRDLYQVRGGAVGHPLAVEGPRGVGKTALLRELAARSQDSGALPIYLAGSIDPDETLAAQIVRNIDQALAEEQGGKAAARRLAKSVTEIKSSLSVGLAAIEIKTERARPDLAAITWTAFDALARHATATSTSVLVMVDELQALSTNDAHRLASAIQRVNGDRLPIAFAAAGLPNTRDSLRSIKAISFIERMLWRPIANLSLVDTARALAGPLREFQRRIDQSELRTAHNLTDGYPYAVQLVGHHIFDNVSQGNLVGEGDVLSAFQWARDVLEHSVIEISWNKLSGREREYVAAAAALAGAGTIAPVGSINQLLNLSPAQTSTTRARILNKGVLTAPARGMVQFVVPGFAQWVQANHLDELSQP